MGVCVCRSDFRLWPFWKKTELAIFPQILRYIGVGGVATFVHVCVALIMHGAVDMAPRHANLFGFAGAVIFSYLGHARYTFELEPHSGFQFLRFVITALIGLAISAGTVSLAERAACDFVFAMAAVAVLVPVVTYFCLRLWVFEGREHEGALGWLEAGVSGVLAVGVLALYWGRMINHDTAWYLVATRQWLMGAELYVGIIEVNPPLNFYFTLPAIAIADFFGISDTNGEYLSVAILLFLSLCWSGVIARKDLGLSTGRRLGLLCGIAAALVLPALNNFGQREHLLVILILPWLLGELASTPATFRIQVIRAGVAALGICLKPHFIVFPLAISGLKAWQERSLMPLFSAANLTFLAVGLGYVGFVAQVHPAYLSQIVPLALEIYGAYAAPIETVFSSIAIEVLVVTMPLLVVLSGSFRYREAGLVAAVAGAGLGAYFLQGTGFGYHAIPFRSFSLIACCFIILKSRELNATVIVGALAIAALLAISTNRGFYRNSPALEIAEVALNHGVVDSLMVLSPHVSVGPSAAIASGASWASRYPANWLVPGAVNRLAITDCVRTAKTCARLESIAALNRTDNIADIIAARPELLVFDLRSGYFDEFNFSWEAFMAKDPNWAEVFGEYSELKRTVRFAFYQRLP